MNITYNSVNEINGMEGRVNKHFSSSQDLWEWAVIKSLANNDNITNAYWVEYIIIDFTGSSADNLSGMDGFTTGDTFETPDDLVLALYN